MSLHVAGCWLSSVRQSCQTVLSPVVKQTQKFAPDRRSAGHALVPRATLTHISSFQVHVSPFLLHFSPITHPHRDGTITSRLLDYDLQQYILGQLPEQNVSHLQFSIFS